MVLTGQASVPLQEGGVCPILHPSPLLASVDLPLRRGVSLSPGILQPLPPVVFMGTRDMLRVTRLTGVINSGPSATKINTREANVGRKEGCYIQGGQYLGEEADSCPNAVSPLPEIQ